MAAGDVNVQLTNALPKWSYKYDGTDDFLYLADLTKMRHSNRPFTVGCWCYLASGATQGDLVSLYETAGDKRAWGLQVTANKPQFIASLDGTSAMATAAIGATTVNYATGWFHIIGRWNGSNLQVFLNGIADDSTPPSITTMYNNTETQIRVGKTVSTAYWKGNIGQIEYWDVGLTDAECLRAGTGKRVERGLKHSWSFEKGSLVDSIGGATLTVSGAVANARDSALAAVIKAQRVTASDKYLITTVNGKACTAVIEES